MSDPPGWLRPCPVPLTRAYDTALTDLDGVVYIGDGAVPHATAALEQARTDGVRIMFVTNNASRPPSAVAAHLTRLGVPAAPDDVVTSAQAAAAMLADGLAPGERVLVVGGEGLRAALAEQGLVPVGRVEDEPAAVVQGFAPDVDWGMLTEGALAVRRGLRWVASNMDLTIPTARGIAPGNGALVGVITAATGRQPEVAGKPASPLLRAAAVRAGAARPLVVGDRLDTDIAGAHAAGFDSLLVLTGITDVAALLAAGRHERPTYLAADLRGLLRSAPAVTSTPDGWRCGGWLACSSPAGADRVGPEPAGPDRVVQERVELERVGPDRAGTDGLDVLRVACAASWARLDAGAEPLAAQVVADAVSHQQAGPAGMASLASDAANGTVSVPSDTVGPTTRGG